ncbi:MAG: hypothetical protein K1X53_12760 [Candidatus Sumerlaeaceae bacterium]|nr:hypothetical protein [Candidatus Sumerlaeaceae bacterium]
MIALPTPYSWHDQNVIRKGMMEEETITRESEEEEVKWSEFDEHFSKWERFTYCDRGTEEGKKEIQRVVSQALEDIWIENTENEAERLNYWLFALYCSPSDKEARTKIAELVGNRIRKVIETDWIDSRK